MDIHIGAFGKLPLHGDFIRQTQGVRELDELDAWLQEGIYRSQQSIGDAWNSVFDALPAARFVFRSPTTGALLVGISTASQDRIGRRYPFMIAARVDGVPAGLTYAQLPLALAGFLDDAETVATTGHEGLDLPAFTARMQQLTATIDVAATERQFETWLAEHSTDQVFDMALPQSDAARRATLLEDISELLRPPFPPKLLLHLPCTGELGELGFWLDVVLRFLPTGELPSLLRWSKGDGRMRFVFDQLDARYFEPMFWPDRENDHAYDLAHGRGADDSFVKTAVQRFGQLASEAQPLSEMRAKLRELEVG